MSDGIIQEEFIKNSPDSLSIEDTSKIIDQMKKYVCQIKYNGKDGTGFFIKIPYKSEELPVLFTNNHIINEEDIKKSKLITLYINNRNLEKNILINENRIFYTNRELDATIIEIKEKKDQIEDFLELDDKIKSSLQMDENEISDYLTNIYSNKGIYTLNYQEGQNIFVSYGSPPQFSITKIRHKCNTKEGSSGSPILLSKNQKVIGIHYGHKENKQYNEGTLIIFPIINFYQKIKNNIINDKEEIQDIINNSNNNESKSKVISHNNDTKNNLISNDHISNKPKM